MIALDRIPLTAEASAAFIYRVIVASEQNGNGAIISKLLVEQHRLQSWIEDLETELANLKSSRSWTITKPLRMARAVAGFLCSRLSFSRHRLSIHPLAGIQELSPNLYQVQPGGYCIVISDLGRKPCGFSQWRLIKGAGWFRLFVDEGEGFKEESSEEIFLEAGKWTPILLPALVRHVRLDPRDQGEWVFSGIEVRELTILGAIVRRAPLMFFSGILAPLKTLRGAYPELQSRQLDNELYRRDLVGRSIKSVSREEYSGAPLFSVLMPVYNTPAKWLRRAIVSVLSQSYKNFELCIVDDASTRPSVEEVLSQFAKLDPRVRVKRRESNGHISAATNSALEMASGKYVVLMDHDDELHSEALGMAADAIKTNSKLKLIFSDEDRISANGLRSDPVFKKSWSRDALVRRNIISHLGIYEVSLARELGFRIGFEGSQDWDFALRFTERLRDQEIYHIPEVLYHWRIVTGTFSITAQTQITAFKAAVKAVNEHFSRIGATKQARLGVGGHLEVVDPKLE